MRIRDSVAFVTGANRGLGLAFARELMTAGAALFFLADYEQAFLADPRLSHCKEVASKGETQMSTISNSLLLIAFAGLFLAPPALGFTTAGYLSSAPSRETLFASLTPPEGQVMTLAVAGRVKKRIYCQDGENRQSSKIHHGWVCSTELAPRGVN
jgi:hypothetical protein